MKKYFYAGIAIILLMALALVAYGAWLNYSDEDQIARRMDERGLQVGGVRAKMMDFHPTVSIDAVRFSSESMTDAVALADGRILHWYVGKNSNVRKGDILLSLGNEQIPLKIQQATSNVKRAEAALAQAFSAYQRQERLMAKEATSQEKYEAAEAQYLAAQEALRDAEAQREQFIVQEDWLNVVSPVDGEVLIIYQKEGAYVQAGMPVALVGNFDRLKFSLNLPDAATRYLRVGDSSLLTFPDQWNMGKAYDTDFGVGNQGWKQKVEARLVDIVPPLGAPADVRRAVWEVDNSTHLLEPMTYTGVTMRLRPSSKCLVVPISAMADASHETVFVADEDGILHRRNVMAGADDGKNIEVYSGLSEGEIVVSGSLDGLEEGMKVEIVLDGE